MPQVDQFLPPLLGGFLFSLWYYPLAYWTARLSGYRLLFATTASALLLVFFAQVIFIATDALPWVHEVREWIAMNFPFSNSDLSLFATALTPVALVIGQAARLLPRLHPAALSRRLLIAEGGAITQAVIESLDYGSLLRVTLVNEKVYVGRVSMTLSRTKQPQSIRLLVDQSGYRDPVTKHVTLDIPYEETHRDLMAELDSQYGDAISRAVDRASGAERSFDVTVQLAMKLVYEEVGGRPDLEGEASLFTVTIPLSEVRSIAPHRADIFERFQSRIAQGSP